MNKDAYQIRKMNDAEFTFMLSGEPNTKYIEGIMEAESISYEQAKAKADKQVNEQLLPEGIKTKDNEFYSLIYKDEFIGLLWLKFDKKDEKKSCWIFDIFVKKEYRGYGFGSILMKYTEDRSRELDVMEVGFHVFAKNKKAISFYEKHGHEITNVIMRKKL